MTIGSASTEQPFKAASEIVSRDNEMTLKDRVPALLTIQEVLHALGLKQVAIKNYKRALELNPQSQALSQDWFTFTPLSLECALKN